MLAGMTRVRAELADCVAAPVFGLSDASLVELLDLAAEVQSQVATVMAHAVREIDGRGLALAAGSWARDGLAARSAAAPGSTAARGTAAWLRDRLRISPMAARRLIELARTLHDRPAIDGALACGALNTEQVATVAASVDHLAASPEVPPDVRDDAEAALIGYAAVLDPLGLRKLGDRILGHVAPEIADRVDAATLARQEKTAHAARGLRMVGRGDGRVQILGWLTTEDAASVNAALDPLCRPVAGDGRSPGQRRADALVEVCQLALHTGELPVNGGERPQVVVTVPFDVVHQKLGIGQLDIGERLSPTAVRRQACDARIIPAMLGGQAQLLDLGRSTRLIAGSLRRALVLRDGGCAFPGCDRPARWTQGHHIVHWEDGGSTSLANSVLLCGPHHRLVHHSDWEVRLGAGGLPEFVPPVAVDPLRRPRRNMYHRRR